MTCFRDRQLARLADSAKVESAREGSNLRPLDYRSSALSALSYAPQFETKRLEEVDPTGLEPAPNGLKVRCTAARASGHHLRTPTGGLEPPSSALTVQRLTFQPRRIVKRVAGTGIEPAFNFDAAYETAVHTSAHPRTRTAAAGLEPAHTRLQDERSFICLSYAAKDGLGGTRTLTRSLQDFYAAFTSPARGGRMR